MTDSMTPGEGMASDGGADKPSGAVARRWRDTTTYGPKPLAALLPGVTRPTFRKRAPATAQVLADWAEIVGPVLAAQTSPRRLSGSTLTLACAGPVALELQHLSGALIQRINGHLGGQVIERLRLCRKPCRARRRSCRAGPPSRSRCLACRPATCMMRWRGSAARCRQGGAALDGALVGRDLHGCRIPHRSARAASAWLRNQTGDKAARQAKR